MSELERLEERLAAIERTVVAEGSDQIDFEDGDSRDETIERLESRLDALEVRIADLEATIQSVDGYVSAVQSVNERVERQADAAIVAVDRLEDRLETMESTASDLPARTDRDGGPASRPDEERPDPTSEGDEAGGSDTNGRGFGTTIQAGVTTVRQWIT